MQNEKDRNSWVFFLNTKCGKELKKKKRGKRDRVREKKAQRERERERERERKIIPSILFVQYGCCFFIAGERVELLNSSSFSLLWLNRIIC